ncbi:MAG: histidine phosphatase family protein [Proteobacteria bacterium]|nr:histidine phosphatase family protein [Pseudomonadota bacterium]
MDDYGISTVNTLKKLMNDGIGKLAVIMRHSARHYDSENPFNEPFLGLTEEGKKLSYKVGEKLPTGPCLRLFSSPVGRCIETAYQIEKGNMSVNGKTRDAILDMKLTAFYVKNIIETFTAISEKGTLAFFREWFDGRVSSDILDPPEEAAATLVRFLVERLDETADSHLDICVSHDWNMYLIKEFFLGLKHEEVGDVEYLEGVIVFRQDNSLYITNHQIAPKKLTITLPSVG